MERDWMYLVDRSSEEYKDGVKSFLKRVSYSRCPCRHCNNTRIWLSGVIEKHLFQYGFTFNYKTWVFHGEGTSVISDPATTLPSPTTVVIGEDEKMRALELSAKLLLLKAENDWTHDSFCSAVRFLRSSFPEGSVGNLPASVEEAKGFLRELGFGYELIHACKYDCALFWKENSSLDKCPVCDEPRFKYENESTGEKIPQKVMYYFPLKPRLQRLFMSEKTAKDMRWHKEKRVEVKGSMSHPADSPQWKSFDEEYPWFAKDSRNIRLGLATKGIKLAGNSCTMWPVTLVPYNLPPEKCASGEFFMMTLLIPGPKPPRLDIDVYLRPLIDELKELWNDGVGTHDASTGETFRLRASLLWTISDFQTYESLSGWCLRGKYSCQTCHNRTQRLDLRGKKFGLKTQKAYLGHRRFLPKGHPWREREDYRKIWGPEEEGPPTVLAGESLLREIESVHSRSPGKHPEHRDESLGQSSFNNWMQKSVFFELEYWHNLPIRHNIDIMYIEQSLCNNIIGTLLDIQVMTKDSKRDRLDLARLDIRKELHFEFIGNRILKPPACYTLSYSGRSELCYFLETVKLPEPYGFDISKKVGLISDKKWGLEARECHVILQRLLPMATFVHLRKDIVTTFSELAVFFQRMCAKTLRDEDFDRLEERIALIYCKLEKIYPPSFFDIITHSALHLPLHAKLTGPVEFRSMYPFEREMEKLGKYIKNRTRPEESIAEAYSANEALRFCSMNTEKKSNRKEEKKHSLSVFAQNAQPFGKKECINLSEREMGRVKLCVVLNCKELEQYIKENEEELNKKSESEDGFEDCIEEESEEDEFPSLFEKYKNEPEKLRQELRSLIIGPNCKVNTYSGCVVDGIRFLTEEEDKNRTNQNSGVCWVKEQKGKKEEFYGILTDVLEVKYRFGFRVILFKCKCFEPRFEGECNISRLNSLTPVEILSHNESYLLASQATMAFYPCSIRRYFPQKFEPGLFWDAIETNNYANGERAEAAKPENFNFKWTEKVGDIENGDLLCKLSLAQVMNKNVLPISGHEIDDVTDKSQMFESLQVDFPSSDDDDSELGYYSDN